jgi:hypothetical protein
MIVKILDEEQNTVVLATAFCWKKRTENRGMLDALFVEQQLMVVAPQWLTLRGLE